MIIEELITLKDNILQWQPYFQKGFADVQVVENAERTGVFLVDNMGEFDYAMQFDYNFFYIRRNGSTGVTGNNQKGYYLRPRYRLFASVKDVNYYKWMECLLSTLTTFCTTFDLQNVETETEKILLTEMKNKDIVRITLSRFKTHKVIAIDFTVIAEFNSFDVRTCECNPCLNCDA